MNQTKYDELMEEAQKLWDEHYKFCIETGERYYSFNVFLSAYHPEIVDELERLGQL